MNATRIVMYALFGLVAASQAAQAQLRSLYVPRLHCDVNPATDGFAADSIVATVAMELENPVRIVDTMAFARFRQAIALGPLGEFPWLMIRQAARFFRRLDTVTALAAEAIRRWPDCEVAYVVLAQAVNDAGQHDDAVSQLRRVVSRFPNDALGWATLATLTSQAGRDSLAVAYFLRTLELDSTYFTDAHSQALSAFQHSIRRVRGLAPARQP